MNQRASMLRYASWHSKKTNQMFSGTREYSYFPSHPPYMETASKKVELEIH